MSTTLSNRSSFLGASTGGRSWDWGGLNNFGDDIFGDKGDDDDDDDSDVIEVAPPPSYVRPAQQNHQRQQHAVRVKQEARNTDFDFDMDDEIVVAQKRLPEHDADQEERVTKKLKTEHDTSDKSDFEQAAESRPLRPAPARKELPRLPPGPPAQKQQNGMGDKKMPFLIDSDSESDSDVDVDDELLVVPVQPLPPKPKPAVNNIAKLQARQREAQRLLSERLRREALEKRGFGTPSSGVSGVGSKAGSGSGGGGDMVRVKRDRTPEGRGVGIGKSGGGGAADVLSLGSSTSGEGMLNRESRVDGNAEEVKGASSRLREAVEPPKIKEEMGGGSVAVAAVELGSASSSRSESATSGRRQEVQSGATQVRASQPVRAVKDEPAASSRGATESLISERVQAPSIPRPSTAMMTIPSAAEPSTTVKVSDELQRGAFSPAASVLAATAKPTMVQNSIQAAPTDIVTDAEVEVRRRIRAENSRKKQEALTAQLRAQAEKERAVEQSALNAQLRDDEAERQQQEAEAQKFRDIDAKIEAEARQCEAESKQQSEVDWTTQQQMRREMEEKRRRTQREEDKARKELKEWEVADRAKLRREAEARKRGEEQRRQSESVWAAVGGRLGGGSASEADGGDAFGSLPSLPSPQVSSGGRGFRENHVEPSTRNFVFNANADVAAKSTSPSQPQAPELSEAHKARQERIQAMKERNARNDASVSDNAANDSLFEDEDELERRQQEQLKAMMQQKERERPTTKFVPLVAQPKAKVAVASTKIAPINGKPAPISLKAILAAQPNGLSSVERRIPGKLQGEVEEDVFAPLPKEMRMPAGPVSLRSVAGRTAPSWFDSPTALEPQKTTPFTKDTPFSFDQEYHKRRYGQKLGVLGFHHIKLFQWSEAGLSWEDIAERYQEVGGVRWTPNTLSKHARQIKETLTHLKVERGVLGRAAEGDEEAIQQLNNLIRSKRPITGSYKKHLGEITPEDIKLLRWRDDGMDWASVIEVYATHAGTRLSEPTLLKRYRAVTDALKAVYIDPETLEGVACGDLEARERLNLAVHGLWPLPRKTGEQDPSDPKFLRELGEITLGDVQLMRWRDAGILRSTILQQYQASFGGRGREDTLRKRYRLVKAAVGNVEIDEILLDQILSGDDAARKQVNRAVHGTWPVPRALLDSQVRKAPITNRGGKKASSFKITLPAVMPGQARFGDRTADSSSTLSSGGHSYQSFSEDPQQIVDDDFAEPLHGADRPTTGGKTLGPAAFLAFTSAYAEANAEESEVEQDDEEVAQEIDEEDLCHFAYHVQRREISKEKLDDDMSLNDMPWIDCGREFDTKLAANIEATRQANISNYADTITELILNGELVRNTDENGLVYATHSTQEAGTVQVKIEQRLRTFKRGAQPKIDNTCVPRVVYFVKEKTTKRTFTTIAKADTADDALFGEEGERTETLEVKTDETVTETFVDNEAFSCLELANKRAIAYCVGKNFDSESRNMNVREMEERELRRELEAELEEQGENVLFRKSAEAGDKSMEVEYLVEMGTLKGPRNF